MKRIVREVVNGQPYYALWSSVVMGTTTDYMLPGPFKRLLHERYPEMTMEEIVKWMQAAVHPDEVWRPLNWKPK